MNELVQTAADGEIMKVKKLLDENVPVNGLDRYKRTALGVACQRGNGKVLDLLISAKVDFHIQDNRGRTPLMHAVQHCKLLDKLLEYIPYEERASAINTRDNDGRSVLHHAVLHKNITAVKLLLKYNGDPHLCDSKGQSCLILAKGIRDVATREAILAVLTPRGPGEEAIEENQLRENVDPSAIRFNKGGLTASEGKSHQVSGQARFAKSEGNVTKPSEKQKSKVDNGMKCGEEMKSPLGKVSNEEPPSKTNDCKKSVTKRATKADSSKCRLELPVVYSISQMVLNV